MEIVIPDFDDDDDDLPLPSFASHSRGQSFGQPPPTTQAFNPPQRIRGDSGASFSFDQSSFGFAFPQTQTQSPQNPYGAGAAPPGSSGSLTSPSRGGFGTRSGSGSSQSLVQGQRGITVGSQIDLGRSGTAWSSQSDLAKPSLSQTISNTAPPVNGSKPDSQPDPPFKGPTKKTSFASFKNAFKSAAGGTTTSANKDDSAGYPSALKNPFNPSRNVAPNSPPSLGRNGQADQFRRPSVTSSGMSYVTTSQMQKRERDKKQSSTTSFSHSSKPSGYSNSATHTTASTSTGSLQARPDIPVPALPVGRPDTTARTNAPRSEYHSHRDSLDEEEFVWEGKVPEPKTPSEFALHVLFRRFVALGDGKVGTLLARPLSQQPSLQALLSRGVDPAFDEILVSLAYVARRHARPVIDSIMGWRKIQGEGVSPSEVRSHLNDGSGPPMKVVDAAAILGERKIMTATFIVNRTLIEILKSIGKDPLEATLGMHLERTVFDAFRAEHPEVLLQSVNRRLISEQAAVILGLLSRTRLLSVSDRFVGEGSELSRILMQANPSRDLEMRSEHLTKGLEQFQLKIYPESELELAAEFLHRTSYLFGHSNGPSLKVTFAQTLVKLLHPLVQTATAEVNHPVFSSAIRDIHERATQMGSKPRYWPSAFPLMAVTLCVSPPAVFKESWLSLVDQAVQRLKDRSCRTIALNAIVRLLWVYLNRCPESATSTGRRLDSLLETYFPPDSTAVRPADTLLDPIVYMVHYILAKQTDYGQDLVMELLQEQSMSLELPRQPGTVVQPERMLISLQATLLTLQMWQEGEIPPWPASTDFERFSFKAVDGTFGEPLSRTVLEKPGVLDFFNRCGPLLGKILLSLDRDLSHLSIFGEATADPRSLPTTAIDSTSEFITRRHQDLPVTYGRRFATKLDLLTSLLHSLPRCLHPATDIVDVATVVSRATTQVDPDTAQAACAALERLVSHHGKPESVLLAYTRFLFGSSLAFGPNCCGSKSYLSQQERLVKLWVNLLEILTIRISAIKSTNDPSQALPVEPPLLAHGEAGSLVLLICHARSLRVLSLTALKSLDAIQQLRVAPLLVRRQSRMYKTSPRVERQTLLQVMERDWTDRTIQSLLSWPHITQEQRSRLDNWYNSHVADMASKLAISEHPQDQGLWTLMLPKVLQRVEATSNDVITNLRTTIASLAVQYQRTVATVSGVTNRPLNGGARGLLDSGTNSENASLAEQWKLILLTLCCITVRATGGVVLTPSDIANGLGHKREALGSGREVFLLITPSLTSEKDRFRDAAIHALGFVRQPLLLPLLQHLHKLSIHIADDIRHREESQKSGPKWDGEHKRLPTAIAQIYMLVSFQANMIRLPQDREALGLMIDFISETYMQLSEKVTKEDFELQRLRRYFCVLVQNISEILPTLDPSAVIFPMKTRAAIFRLCDEWCTLGRRADVAKARESVTMLAAAERYRLDRNKAQYLNILQNDTRELSISAASAMASLCMGPLIKADSTTSNPQSGPGDVEPLSVLQWIRGLFSSSEPRCHSLGRKALGELIKNNFSCGRLIHEVIHQAYAEGDQFTLSKCFFGVLVRAQIKGDLKLSFAQVACLGLSKMGHTDVAFRVRALSMLETLFPKDGKAVLSLCSGNAGSSSMKLYLGAQTQASQLLAVNFPSEAAELVAECTTRVSQLDASRRVATLAILPPWLQGISMSGERGDERDTADASLDRSTMIILTCVFYVSIRFGDDHPLDIAQLWTSLSENQSPLNVSSIVIYLIGQATSRPNFEGFSHAKKAISYYAGTTSAPVIFYSLCSLIEPAQFMTMGLSEGQSADLNLNHLVNLDSILGKVGRNQTISTGHVAMLFAGELLSEAMIANPDIAGGTLAILLHALMTQVDSDVPIVREQAQKLVHQTMATWSGGDNQWSESEDLAGWDSGNLVSAESVFEGFWSRDSVVEGPPWFIPSQMAGIVKRVLDGLTKNLPDIRQDWGEQALVWATECTVPHIACRSFQIFRVLMPAISPSMLVSIMSRYSITAAGSTSIYQSFNREVLYTMCSVVQATDGDDLLSFPQLFWCIAAALSTPVLEEYQLVVELLAHYLDKVDLGEMKVMRHLLDNQPPNWIGGEFKLQTMLLPGLRSSLTMEASFDIIRRLAGISFDNLIDSSRHRLMHLFVSSMPWLLTANDRAQADPEIDGLADDIAALADREGQSGLARIMTSLARRRFRTKEDFIKQSASCIRDFLRTSSSEIVILLLGMVLNNENWIRNKAMLMLKLVFQDPEARKPLATYGSELLMPLLRLLSGPLASEALEVLDTTVVFSGAGGAAANVLRMSMVGPTLLQAEQDQSSGKVFGVPDETGWCAAKPTEAASMTRRNIDAVISTFDEDIRGIPPASGPALLDVDPLSADMAAGQLVVESQEGADSLGDLVGALHTLSNFFEEEEEEGKGSGDFDDRPLTMRRKSKAPEPAGERRVRAILARSLIRRSSFDWTIEPPPKDLIAPAGHNLVISGEMPPLTTESGPGQATSKSAQCSADEAGDKVDQTFQFAQWRSQLHQHHASISSAGSHSAQSEANFELDTEIAPPPDLAALNLSRMQSPSSSVGEGAKRPARFRNLLLGRTLATSPRP